MTETCRPRLDHESAHDTELHLTRNSQSLPDPNQRTSVPQEINAVGWYYSPARNCRRAPSPIILRNLTPDGSHPEAGSPRNQTAGSD